MKALDYRVNNMGRTGMIVALIHESQVLTLLTVRGPHNDETIENIGIL
jgi:hypothetical protein